MKECRDILPSLWTRQVLRPRLSEEPEANHEGELLALAEREAFDVLVTNDKNITAQQNLRGRNIAIVVLPTNRRRDVMALAPRIANAIKRVQPGQWIVLDPD